MLQVSVITPVYNAEPFLRRSVEATLSQPEVSELILVEDGSPDNSLQLCRELATHDSRIRVIQHPDHGNHGAGATRNLGMREAKCEFIAFADADNFYLPNRFEHERRLLPADSSLDGVVNAQGVHYENEEVREAFFEAGLGGGEFLSVSSMVVPDDFWKVMLGCHPVSQVIGGLGIDAITLRKTALNKIGYFEPALRLQQDVHFFFRMACTCRLATGSIEQAVAKRGVHGQMRSTDSAAMNQGRKLCWTLLRDWSHKHVNNPEIREAFERAFLLRSFSWQSPTRNRLTFLRYAALHPSLIAETYGLFDLNLLRLFGRNWFTLHALSFKNRIFRHR